MEAKGSIAAGVEAKMGTPLGDASAGVSVAPGQFKDGSLKIDPFGAGAKIEPVVQKHSGTRSAILCDWITVGLLK